MNTNENDKVKVVTQKIVIPTYLQGTPEELPMFCENRVHQRTSGNPYPNPIINQVFRDIKEDKEYEAIIVENDYLQITILPELGGRIFSALDKTNNYNFFYKQSVIKPGGKDKPNVIEIIDMKKLKFYNVKKGVWHS